MTNIPRNYRDPFTLKSLVFPPAARVIRRAFLFSLVLSLVATSAVHAQNNPMWDFVREKKETSGPHPFLSAQFLLLSQIHLYQFLLSEQQPDACNFSPSCSHFAYQAIKKKGSLEGTLMAVDRLQRCNPWAWNYHGTYYGVTWVPGRGYKLLDPP
jgi:putative membrane protein insertion efficiency factor